MDLVKVIQEQMQNYLPGHLGIEIMQADKELVTASLAVKRNVCTLGDRLHGGAIMAFADTLGAVGAFLNLPEGAATTTIESKTNFTGGAPLDSRVIGKAELIHNGKTLSVWQTRIETEEGKLVAMVTQSQMVLLPKN